MAENEAEFFDANWGFVTLGTFQVSVRFPAP